MDETSDKRPKDGLDGAKNGNKSDELEQGFVSSAPKEAIPATEASKESEPGVSPKGSLKQTEIGPNTGESALEQEEVPEKKQQDKEPQTTAALKASIETKDSPKSLEQQDQKQALSPQTKEEKVASILALKAKISALLTNVKDTKILCEKHENENQYLQDYVATLMQNGELRK